MKANELRIGNFIIYEKTTHYVSGITHNTVFSHWHKDAEMVDEYMDIIDYYDPIQLTEEWLMKFGFIDRKILIGCLCFMEIDIDGTDFNIFIRQGNIENEDTDLILLDEPILYVHQLQNLYFALTGEELTLK